MFIAKKFEKEMNNSMKKTEKIHLAKKKKYKKKLNLYIFLL
jgi:hypothetical protein